MSGFDALVSISASLFAATGTPTFVAFSSWLLGFVFVWSGVAKVRRPVPTAFALLRFGLVLQARTSYGVAVALLELALASALFARLPLGAAAAAFLLWFFVALLLRELIAGRREPCFCFGSEAPLSWLSAGRTLGLAVLATRLAIAGPAGLDAGVETLAAIIAAALVGIATLSATLPSLISATAVRPEAAAQP